MFTEYILENRTAFISGGTSGINLGIAKGLAKLGARVCVIGRDLTKAQKAATEIMAESGVEAIGLSADVRDYEAVEGAMKIACNRFGELDIVIAGAAGNFFAPAVSISSKGFKTVVDIDLIGTYNVFKAAFDCCKKPGSSFIAITAGQAVNPMPYQAHVCAAKAGVNALLKTLAMEWGAAGIRVNGISPGPIEGTEGVERLAPTDEEKNAIIKKIALRRFGQAEDVANAAIFLSSSLGQYVTGAIFDIEGGFQLGDSSMDCLSPTR
ncbi:SDR family oxidoreductase [Oceanicoccus sp. KOV_DT_Chl]|uniref:SDR family oxidoreductase n=1 Tax=Oceanicoccus sp. KOV_DT_Chl TaxID=1904639 RepID=UPI000C7C770F|nr:SDR family oxidoreductase [Oceanicoccus sp. KOV_DT_Chl]